MEIYLIRHTTPSVDQGVCYGHTDVPLADTFEEEWRQLKNKIPARFDAVFSSPLFRCTALARRLATGEYRMDFRLLELNFGSWETRRWDDIDREELNAWMKDFVGLTPPEGESFQELYERSSQFLEEIIRMHYQSVACVTHAGVIRTMLTHVLKIPLENVYQLGIDYGKISRVDIDGEVRKVSFINL